MVTDGEVALNFLEQLVSEWYGYKGFFVRTNVKFGKRPEGGCEGEMDVVAFMPKPQTLVHVETSSDADSWKERQARFQKKFNAARKHYKSIFKWNYATVQQIAVVGYGETPRALDFGEGITVISIPQLMNQIKSEIKKIEPTQEVIPEGYPLLRAIQFAVGF